MTSTQLRTWVQRWRELGLVVEMRTPYASSEEYLCISRVADAVLADPDHRALLEELEQTLLQSITGRSVWSTDWSLFLCLARIALYRGEGELVLSHFDAALQRSHYGYRISELELLTFLMPPASPAGALKRLPPGLLGHYLARAAAAHVGGSRGGRGSPHRALAEREL